LPAPQSSSAIVRKSFDNPPEMLARDEVLKQTVNLGSLTLTRAVYGVGWKSFEGNKPTADDESCESKHTIYVVSGRMRILMDGGEEQEFGPGNLGVIPAGHHVLVVGDEPFEAIDFGV
jgi:uncharacterized cupin superfamily protein